MKKHNVRKKILIPLSLTFLVLITAFLYASYSIRQKDEAVSVQKSYLNVQSVFSGLLAHDTHVMISTAQFIGNKVRFQRAMQEGNLEALQAHAQVVFERISRDLQITHFYFHDARGELVLRVYQPDNRRQGPLRVTMQRALESGYPTAGLEIGKFGTFAHRLVYPWWVDGELLGHIELGTDISPVLWMLKEITQTELLVTLDKRFLSREAWEDRRANLGHDSEWDLMPDKLIAESTLQLPGETLRRILSNTGKATPMKIDGRTFRAEAFPLRDAGQRDVGEFLVMVDVTSEAAAFRQFGLNIFAFSLLLSSALFIFAFKILGRVERHLVTNENRLRRESALQIETNDRLQIEVAERRRAEEELVKLNQDLEHRVGERTRDLKHLNEALQVAYKDLQEKQATILHQEKMACLGQLAAGVAHDITNPVGFVGRNLKLLERYLGRLSRFFSLQDELLNTRGDAETRAEIDKIRVRLKLDYILGELPDMVAECSEGTARIRQIVLNLRNFSRSDVPEGTLADLHQCLDSTLTITSHEWRKKIVIVREYGDIPMLWCYPDQLKQVFMNLLINAAQAIEVRGEIRIRTWVDNGHVHVAVADTGAGIPEETRKKIFDPFFTTKDAGQGTGLGLSIVSEIVIRHGGGIRVESEVGKGSVFTVSLPCDDGAAAAAMATAMDRDSVKEGRDVDGDGKGVANG